MKLQIDKPTKTLKTTMFFLSDYIPSYIQYFLTTTSIFALAVTSLLYSYQCSLIYLAGVPAGSRQVVSVISRNVSCDIRFILHEYLHL
jgi:hypothetical protein